LTGDISHDTILVEVIVLKATEVMKLIREKHDIKITTIASRMGKLTGVKDDDKKIINTFVKRFTQDNISVGLLNEMLRAMDYKVVVMPVSHKTPEDGYEID